MESLQIIAMCLLAGALYGILHDQVTARVCLEYFTVFHPDIFHTQSPTLLALGWGVLSTWWLSLFLGILLAIAARAGSRPRVTSYDLIPKILTLLVIMALCALAAGITGYFLQGLGLEYYATDIPKHIRHSFYADLWAHNMSLSSSAVTPSGLSRPSVLGMYTLRTGLALYAPRFSLWERSWRLTSRSSP